jgi:hypothetical protein
MITLLTILNIISFSYLAINIGFKCSKLAFIGLFLMFANVLNIILLNLTKGF